MSIFDMCIFSATGFMEINVSIEKEFSLVKWLKGVMAEQGT